MDERNGKTVESAPQGNSIVGFALFCVFGAFLGVFIYSLFSPCSCRRFRPWALRVLCANNLSDIGKGMMKYAEANEGRLPAMPSLLIAEGHAQVDAFMCPSVEGQGLGEIREDDDGSISEEEWARLVDAESDYLIIFRNVNFEKLPHDALEAYELYENHRWKRYGEPGVNVLKLNGGVQWINDFSFQPQIQRSHDILNQLRKEGEK